MRRGLGILLVIVLAGVFLFTTGRLLLILHRYRTEEQLYQNASQQFTLEAPAKQDGEGSASGIPLEVDFAELTAVNDDVVGWICCEDTVISYPVLHGADNDAYLRRDFRGAYAFCGSIFTDAENAKGFADANTLVYGHNMKDGTMFGLLSHYRQKAFWRAHPFISLTTLWEPEEYVIFAVMDAPLDINDRDYVNYYSHARFSSDGEFTAFIEALRVQSLIPPALDVRPSDGLLSLATCIGDRRLVVTARRIRPDETKEMLRRQIR